ncbi:alpha-D-ribose 1-methylphosphonate 5-triphosphate diphosphatase, partial [Agrobacterium sp. S2]|nr:alpha-D-ribose 1-methylphosphonate 5-triphosphate diphosphatase [Agrobacterium sp. S2]
MTEHALSNARIVLEDDIILGSVLIRDGKIADISEGASKTGEDLEGDFL